MVCQACNSFKAQLALKDEELKELNSKFATYKLKSKARLAQLKQSLTEGIPNAERWQEERATLLMRLAEAESELENRQQEAEDLRSKLASREIELSDHAIRVRSLEEQLRSAWGDHTSVDERQCPADVEEMAKRDLGRMHSQMVYKDTRIMELNTTILDRERQILDLQEMCREQVQLLQAKARAFQIIQQRFLEIDSRTTKEASTETDLSLSLIGRSSASSMSGSARKEAMRARFRESTTPGHAVVQLRPGERMSPPPVDPSEDRSSFTTETATLLDEGDSELKTTAVATSASMEGKRKQRKKVTFDLTPQTAEAHGLDAAVDDEIAQAIIDLTTENDQLRRTIQEMETCAASELQKRIDQLEEEMQQVRRDGKNQALKARASAQGRIRELEERIAAMEQEQKDEVERLNANVETLRADREWTLEENAGLLKQLSTSRQKFEELREELDQSHVEYENLRTELAKDRDVIVKLADDVEEAQRTANLLFEQKMSILDDVDRLKEAIEAQGEYIDVLEADIVIYEEHVGLLRDSLGASKIEKRKLIKSKAFETKLRALEQEKEQMTRRNNDERLRIKALCAKIRSLEEENVGIVARLEEAEATLRKVQKGNAEKRETTDVAQLNSSDDEGISGRKQQNPLIETLAVSLQENESRSRKYGSLESADEGQGVEKELRQQAADSRKIVDSRNEELIEARDEIGCLKRELEEAHDRIQHMECANFELERELKEARTSASLAEDTAKQASERLVVLAGAEEHLFAGQQHNVEELLQTSLETTNSLRHQLAEMESEMALVKEELNTRTAELNAAKEEARESRNALDCAKLATYEVEADDEGVQALKQQLTEVESEMALVKAELNTRNEELNVAKEEARESRNELERAKLTISAMEDVEEEARALKQQLTEMESEMALVKAELNTRNEELNVAKEEARESRNELERAKLTISAMEDVEEEARALKQQLTEMESEMANVKDELNTRKEELSAAKEETRRSRNELEHAKLAMSEMEAVDREVQALKQQLDKEKASLATEWTEVRSMLVNKEREIPLTSSRQLFLPTHRTEELSRRLEELESAVAQLNASVKPQTNRLVSTDDERGKQNLAKLKEGMGTVCDEERLHVRKLNTVGEGRSAANVGPVEFEEELEKRYEASLANADCAIVGMLSLNKLAAQTNGEKQLSLAQPIQRVNTEAQNAETSVQDERECAALLSGIEAAIRAMNEARRVVENLEQEKSEPEERQQVEDSESAHMMEDESSLAATADDLCTIALNDEGQNSPSVEEDCGLETVEELKREIESLRALLSEDAARAEMELQKMREAIKTLETEKLDLRQQIVLLTARMADDDECSVNNDAACISYSTSANTLELHGKLPSHGNDTSELHHSLESRLVGESESEERTNRQEQIEGNSSEVANVEGNQMLSTVALLESDRSEQYGRLTDAKLEEEVRHSIEEQNALLREHITENWCMQENLFEDVGHLMVLNNELETAVEALKGELWSLNGQLKASLADREELSEKLCEMARLRENEREEARERERELEDQKEMAERSQRQAALAENESNRRLAEWQEKSAEMEARREEVEAAYALLTTYYQQLQEAYSTLYARFCIAKADATTEMHAEGEQPDEHHPQLSKAKLEIESLREELEARQEELGKAKSQLEQLRALAITELSSLRKLVLQIRGEEITRLKNAIVESISETANELREIYEHAIEILSNADRIRDAERAESICAMRELVEEIFKKSEREIAVINDVSLTSAVQMAKEELCEKQRVVEETRKALAEQRMACRALECKLQEAEAEREVNNYTHELEQLLETTQISLSRHIDKCQRLQERVDLLERSEEGQRNANEAARLTTKRADNDALFRCNAELAHTNVRLQNEVDQLRAQLDELSTASLSSDRPAEHTEPSQIAQVVSDVGSGVIDWGGGEQEALGDWEWGGLGEKEIGKSEDESAFTSERSAKLSEIVEAEGLNTCLEIAQTVETMKTVRPFGTEATGRTQIETGGNQQSGIPETRFEDMERHANSLLAEKENLLAAKESLCDEVNKLSVRLNEMEKMYAEERERRVQLEVQLNSRASIEASQPSSNSMKQPSLEGSEENGWGWSEQVEINELVRSPYVDSDIECDRLNKIITHLQGELCVAQQSFEKMTERHLESEHSQRKMQEEFDRERTEFMARMNYSEQMVKDLKDELENASKQILFAHQANARICELKEENARLQKGETSLRRLLEGLEKKLGDSEDYGLNMEEKNEKLEATVAELQLELANAVKNLDETAANLQQADRSKEQETAEERRETHESLVIVEKLREEVAALKHERKELTEKLLQAGTKQAEEVEEQSKGHENELCSLRERYESNQRELMKKITMLETDSMKMTVEINRLNEKLLEGESKAAKVDELLMKLSEYERTVVEKSEELILSRRENETLNSEMQLLKEDISQRTAKLNELNSEVESANKVVEHLQNELRQTKRQNELLQDSECRLMESADQNERRVGEVEAENDRLVIELKNMETKLSAALTKEGERCVLIEELEARISEAENKLTNTRHELEEREALLATRIQSSYESRMVQTTFTPNEAPLPDAESATAAVCASSNEDVDNLKARLRFLEEKQRDSEFTAIQNEQLLSKIDALEQDYKKLSAEKTLLLKRIKIMKAKLDAYKEEAETHSMRADSSLFLLGSEASKLRRTSAEPLCDEAHLSSVESTVCDISLTSATNPPSQQNQQEMMRRGVKENDVDLDETIRQLQTTKEAFAIELERLDGLRSACEGCKVQVGASIQALLVANGHDVTDKRPTYCLQPESHEARLEDGKRVVLQKNSTQEEFSCQEYIGSAEIEIGLEAECCEDRTDLQSRKSSELEGVSKPRADGLLKASENDGAQTGSKDSETTPSNLVDVTDDVFQVVDTNQCNGVQLFECRGKRTWDELCKLGVKLLMNLKQLNEELERALNSNVKVSKLFQAECSQCKALIESKRAHVQESEHHERLRRLPVEGNEQDINMCEHEQSIKHLTANCERIQEEDVELAACTKQLWTTGDKRRAEVGLIDEQLLRTNEENSAMCVQSGVQIINSNEIGPTLHALISGSLCINYDEIDVGANSQVECIAEQSLERENLKPSEQSLTVVEGPSKQEAESLELNRQTTQDLQLKLCKVEEENIRLKAQLKDARAAQIRVSKLEAENIELEGRWDVLRSEADDMELENVELRSSLGEMRRMKRQAEDIATEVLGLRANLEAAQATEARMKELEADNAQLRISLEGENVLKNRLHEVEISNEHLEATMRELQAKLEAAEAVKARVKELEADNAQLKISLEGENVLNDRLRELEVDNEHLKRNLANLNVSNNVVEAEVGDLKEKLAEAQVRVKDLEAEIIEHHEKSAKIKETLRDKNAEIVQLRATMRLVKRAEIGMQKLQSENLVLKKRLGAEINELFDSDSGQRKNLGDYGVKLPTTTKEGAMVGGLRSAEEGIGDEGSQTNGWDLGGLENHIDQRTPPATSGMLDSELVGVLERMDFCHVDASVKENLIVGKSASNAKKLDVECGHNEELDELETLRREVALKNAHIETLCNDNAASNETILAINQHSKALSQKIRELEFEIEQVISASKTVEVTLEPARSDAATELANAEQRLRDNEDEKDSLNNTLFETKKELDECQQRLSLVSERGQKLCEECRIRADNKTNETIISHLQMDNVRLEQDLLNAHNEIACYVAEVENKAKWQHSLEGALRSLQLQNNSLTAELARARSTRESMASSAEALNHMEALEAKVIQLEQSHATQEQLIDELRIAETKLSMVEDTVRENESRIEQLQDSVEEWRRRFEEVSQENETLHRANEEVQNLERAINEINTEKQDYYQQLGDVMEEKRQLIASRDHLFKRLNEANAHIDMLQTKLCRTTEARTMSTMRIVEMEADIRRLNAKLASLEAQAAKSDNNDEESYAAALETENAVPKEQMEGMSSSTSSSDARLLDLEKADACKPIVQAEQTNSAEKNEGVTLEPGSTANNLADSVNEMQRTIAALTEQLRIAQDTIETLTDRSTRISVEDSEADFQNSNTELIPATVPWPLLVSRLRRLLRSMPHRRHAVMPYFRFLMLVYVVFLHIAFFQCYFF